MNKTLAIAGCAVLSALALSACVSPSAVTGAPSSTAGLSAADQVAVLKEVNRHLETCDRTYAWPFAVTIHCAPVGTAPATTATQTLTAADIAALVDAAVARALAGPSK